MEHRKPPTVNQLVVVEALAELDALLALISKLTKLCCPFWHFSCLFHLLSREKSKKREVFSASEQFKYFLREIYIHIFLKNYTHLICVQRMTH